MPDDEPTIYWAGIACIRDGRLCTLKEYSKDFYMVPGGKLEAGESAEAAAIREIMEELGVGCRIIDKLIEVNEISRTTGQLIHFTVFRGEFLDEIKLDDLPKSTESVAWIDSKSEVDRGNLLKNHVMPELIRTRLVR